MQNKDTLQDKFKDFGAQPSDALWDSIASTLDNKRKKKIIWFWWFGAVASIALILGISFYLNEKDTNHKIVSNQTNIQNESVKTKDELDKNKVETQIKIEELESIEIQPTTPSINTIAATKKKPQQTVITTTITVNPKQSIDNASVHTEPEHIILNNKPHQLSCEDCNLTIQPRPMEVLAIALPQNLVLNTLTSSKQPRQFEYSFNAVTFFNINKKEQDYALPTASTNSSLTPSIADEFSTNESLVPNSNLQFKRSIPLVLRFGVATTLSTRFKLQSGLDFGWISTTPLSAGYYYKKSSNFTVGVPIFIKFHIINKRRFDFNANLGAINDFALLRQDKTYIYETLQANNFQFTKGFLGGLETGVSFDYKFNENLKIGIGTGVKWYYYQNYPNLSSQKKNNTFYNLNLGLAWNY